MTMPILFAGCLAVAAAAPASANANDRAAVQDPPGRVGVEQPAGVGFDDRGSKRDTTHPMYGSTYADLDAPGRTPDPAAHIPSPTEPAATRDEPTVTPPQQGGDVRTSFQGQTASGSNTSHGITDTALGTDLGYGTGTEQPSR